MCPGILMIPETHEIVRRLLFSGDERYSAIV